jgi:hypothetical protein
MDLQLKPGDKRNVVTADLGEGTPVHVLAAWKANASNDPEAVEAAKQRLQKRDGHRYAWSAATKVFTRLPAIVHVPVRREPVANAGEQGQRSGGRPRRAGSSRDGPSSESDPPPARPRLTRAERAALKAKVDARRREVVRATEKVERSLERHWRKDAA